MSDKVIISCALTGVLTDPKRFPVPVTPEEMAREAKAAFDQGASIMHVHFRRQEPGNGHLPSWEPKVAVEITDAIRAACPGVILNQSTGFRLPAAVGVPARGQAGDRRVQCGLAELFENQFGRHLVVAAGNF